MSDERDDRRRKRLLWLSSHRGTKEDDLKQELDVDYGLFRDLLRSYVRA